MKKKKNKNSVVVDCYFYERKIRKIISKCEMLNDLKTYYYWQVVDNSPNNLKSFHYKIPWRMLHLKCPNWLLSQFPKQKLDYCEL